MICVNERGFTKTVAYPEFLRDGINLIPKPQYKDFYRRTIEMPQHACTFKVNCCLKVHNVHLKLLSLISEYVHDPPVNKIKRRTI